MPDHADRDDRGEPSLPEEFDDAPAWVREFMSQRAGVPSPLDGLQEEVDRFEAVLESLSPEELGYFKLLAGLTPTRLLPRNVVDAHFSEHGHPQASGFTTKLIELELLVDQGDSVILPLAVHALACHHRGDDQIIVNL